MAFRNWKALKKIDAHIHILPDPVHAANPDADDIWVYANIHKYQDIMVANHIEKAVIMPFNDPYLMSMEFTVDAVHQNLQRMKQQYPNQFYAFADVDVRNTSEETVSAINRAICSESLDGIKIHPNNTGIVVDSDYNNPIFAFAQEKGIPVAIHSYPSTWDDVSAAKRIVSVAERYPNLKLIVSHLGAFQWECLLATGCYVDLSAILPDYVHTYGMQRTNEILRKFGADRILFATDYPDSRHLEPDEIYDSYFAILNQMDFTGEEAEKIAYKNTEDLLGGL